MLKDETVCFTGHRELPADTAQITQELDRVLAILYRQGKKRFLNGAALGFDQLAAERVLALRKKHDDVKLIMVVPCVGQSRRWNDEQRERYDAIIMAADECRTLSRRYYNGCMNVRNRYMVDRSSACVCYLDQPKGGTLSTVTYAMSNDVRLINLADCDRLSDFYTEQA